MHPVAKIVFGYQYLGTNELVFFKQVGIGVDQGHLSYRSQ